MLVVGLVKHHAISMPSETQQIISGEITNNPITYLE